jgi:hypothetical protein
MNWTCGRLQRHSLSAKAGTNRSLKAVQKQHFAKKRLALKDGGSVSPIKVLGVHSRFQDGGRHEGEEGWRLRYIRDWHASSAFGTPSARMTFLQGT